MCTINYSFESTAISFQFQFSPIWGPFFYLFGPFRAIFQNLRGYLSRYLRLILELGLDQSAYLMLVAICELRFSTNSWTLKGAYIGFCNFVDSYFLTKSFLELKVSELQMVAMSVLNLSSLGILNCDRLASGRRKCYYIIIF